MVSIRIYILSWCTICLESDNKGNLRLLYEYEPSISSVPPPPWLSVSAILRCIP